jgi:hypothetical protein
MYFLILIHISWYSSSNPVMQPPAKVAGLFQQSVLVMHVSAHQFYKLLRKQKKNVAETKQISCGNKIKVWLRKKKNLLKQEKNLLSKKKILLKQTLKFVLSRIIYSPNSSQTLVYWFMINTIQVFGVCVGGRRLCAGTTSLIPDFFLGIPPWPLIF